MKRAPRKKSPTFEELKESFGRSRCWIWAGGCFRDGYPRLLGHAAHRTFYERVHGKMEAGIELTPTCGGGRLCVNPWHFKSQPKDRGVFRAILEKRQPRFVSTVRVVGGDAFIALADGSEVVVDKADLDLVHHLAWYAEKHRGLMYAVHQNTAEEREAGAPKSTRMQNLINPPPPGMINDHRDGDGLNNRRSNLRHCTRAQNARNRRPVRGRELPKGVILAGRRYSAKITAGGETHNLGLFDTVEEAAAAYDRAALEHHGEFARPNNPVAPEPSAVEDLIEEFSREPFDDGWSGRRRR